MSLQYPWAHRSSTVCLFSDVTVFGFQQIVPSMDRFGPAGCPGANSFRGAFPPHSHMSPENVRFIHRHR